MGGWHSHCAPHRVQRSEWNEYSLHRRKPGVWVEVEHDAHARAKPQARPLSSGNTSSDWATLDRGAAMPSLHVLLFAMGCLHVRPGVRVSPTRATRCLAWRRCPAGQRPPRGAVREPLARGHKHAQRAPCQRSKLLRWRRLVFFFEVGDAFPPGGFVRAASKKRFVRLRTELCPSPPGWVFRRPPRRKAGWLSFSSMLRVTGSDPLLAVLAASAFRSFPWEPRAPKRLLRTGAS